MPNGGARRNLLFQGFPLQEFVQIKLQFLEGRKMKSTQKSTMLITVMVAMLCVDVPSYSAPVGTAFTYQGRLLDANELADGLYDFKFRLYNAGRGGSQIGTDVDAADIDVIDGYFTAELDFGSVFDSNAVWLDIGVRAGALGDPNAYISLSPRQRIAPAPYALYALNGASSEWIVSGSNLYCGIAGNVGIGTANPQARLSLGAEMPPLQKKLAIWDGINDFYGLGADWGRLDFYTHNTVKMTIMDSGKVGLGTTSPEQILHIKGSGPRILIEGNASNPEVNFKLNGDPPADIWALYKHSVTEDLRFYQAGDRVVIKYGTGNVGIGTTSPLSKLSVGGDGYNNVGIYGQGENCGISGVSDAGVAVRGTNNNEGTQGELGNQTYGAYGWHHDSDNWGYLGGSDYGAYGQHYNGNCGYIGGSSYAVYGKHVSSGNDGYIGGSYYGLYGSHFDSGNYGYIGGNLYAGYFGGNVYATGNVSALSFTDRTPYPKDLQTAYDAVMSMERLPDGQYDENNKENQLDHSKMSSFIRRADGNRDLSATVSCLNEVVKDLAKKVESQQHIIELQNIQIQKMIELLQTNKSLKLNSGGEQ
jgi:hypothetical protein